MNDQRLMRLSLTLAAALLAGPVAAQIKAPPTPEQWGEFEELGVQQRGGLSPRW